MCSDRRKTKINYSVKFNNENITALMRIRNISMEELKKTMIHSILQRRVQYKTLISFVGYA
jgi:hypothetical protein